MAGAQTPTDEWQIGEIQWDISSEPKPVDADLEGVAGQVLEAFDIPTAENIEGGKLAGLDIHNMNAIAVMRLSIFEEWVKGGTHYEVYASENGLAKKYIIGGAPGDLDIRYSVPTRNVVNPVDQVKVVGFDAPPYIYTGEEYDIIGGSPVVTTEQIDPIWLLVSETCYETVFERYAYFVYRSPVLDSDFNDQIDSLFEANYDESVIAWVHSLEGGENLSDRGTINFSDISFYPLSLKNDLGDFEIELFPIQIEYTSPDEARCWIAPEESRISTIININDDRFLYQEPGFDGQTVSDVEDLAYFILVGHKVTAASSFPTRDLAGRAFPGAGITYVEYDEAKTAISLQEGVDYTYWFDGDQLVVSAGYVQKYEFEEFGAGLYATDWGYPEGYTFSEGYLWPRLGGTGIDSSGLGNAMWVTDMFLVLRRRISSVTIQEPEGVADLVLDDLRYTVTPIIQRDPNPITCGYGDFTGCVDWATTVFDTDPLTIQDLYETSDIALLNDALAQGAASVVVDAPYLYEEVDVQSAAEKIYSLFQDSEVTEKTHVCGPNSTPQLGGSFSGGYVNSINYSYNDESSYNISVVTGPKLTRDLPSMGTNIWMMSTETIKRRGTVTQSAGDGLYYVVTVGGLGEFIAVNTVVGVASPEIGDVVDVEINNVPQGWA